MALVDDEFRVPEELYVGYRGKSAQFGFVIPYGENNPSYQSRKWTVDKWSTDTPEVIKNTPQSGFEIKFMTTVSRTGNKKWRIHDPRGFDVEISSKNLSRIFPKVTIDKGVIQEECAWCFDGQGDNWLLPADSDEFEEGRQFSKLRSQRVTLRDVSRGDKIVLHDGRAVRYLGGLYFLDQKSEIKRRRRRYGGSEEVERGPNVKRWYFFLSEDENGELTKLDSKSSIKVSYIAEKTSAPLTGKQAERMVNKLERTQKALTYPIQGPSFFRASNFSGSDVEIISRPPEVDVKDLKGKVCPFLYVTLGKRNSVGVEAGTYFVSYASSYNGMSYTLAKFKLKALEDRCALIPIYEQGYGRLKSFRCKEEVIGQLDWKEVWCRVDDEEYRTFY